MVLALRSRWMGAQGTAQPQLQMAAPLRVAGRRALVTFRASILLRAGIESGMAKAKFDRTKPHVNVGTIGHVDHGKTTTDRSPDESLVGQGLGYEALSRTTRLPRRPRSQGRRDATKILTIATTSRRVRDRQAPLRARRLPGHADYVKNMITGAAQMDGAILVVSALPTARCRRRASTSCSPARSNVPRIVVFLNKVRHGRRPRAARSGRARGRASCCRSTASQATRRRSFAARAHRRSSLGDPA